MFLTISLEFILQFFDSLKKETENSYMIMICNTYQKTSLGFLPLSNQDGRLYLGVRLGFILTEFSGLKSLSKLRLS